MRPGDRARRVAGGERYEVIREPGRRYRPSARPRSGRGYATLHQDRDLLVVYKRPDLLTVPTPLREGEESLVERLLEAERRRGVRRPALYALHRLDRDTSGLLLFARSRRAIAALQEQFEDRSIDRRYVAVAEGALPQDRGRLVSRLVESGRSLKMRSARGRRAGKQAITEYEVIERLPGASVLAVRILTGRKNQIRVQLAESGHPLVGDRRYGRPSALIGRTALHARSICFVHPADGRRVIFSSPLPGDMRRLIRSLRRGR
ncbi:MAG: RluA family pseudouridine synthase [Acidobacteriota bacterium]